MAVTLRPSTSDDQPFLLTVYASSRAPEMVQLPWDDAQKQAFLTAQFQAQHQHYLTEYPEATYDLVLRDAAPVGRLYVDRRPDEIRILDLWVLGVDEDDLLRTVLGTLLDEATATSQPVGMYVEVYKTAFLALLHDLGFVQQEDYGVSQLMRWHPVL